jgi:hypothetical protein
MHFFVCYVYFVSVILLFLNIVDLYFYFIFLGLRGRGQIHN